MARLFAWKAGESDLDQRMTPVEIDACLAVGDMGSITDDDLERYKTHLGTRAFDHLLDLRPLFALVQKRKLIQVDPAADIDLPAKRENSRSSLDREEAARILIRTENAKPYIRWMIRIACYSGAIPSELLVLTTDSVRQHHGVWSLFVQPPKGQHMKTEYRPRIIPLHPAIRDEFLAYWRSLPSGPLFPDAPTTAKNRLNEFIHDCGIAKTYYSFRHTVSDQLETIVMDLPVKGKLQVPPDLADYIMGHTPKTMRAKHYLHPETKRRFPEVVAAINGLEDPTMPERMIG